MINDKFLSPNVDSSINEILLLTAELLELCYNVKLANLMHDGRSALSYAASMNYLEKVEILIRYDPSSAFISNEDKTFPIHVAVLGGHTSIVDLLTNSRFLLNAKGQNIFHLAALSGDSYMVSHDSFDT